LILIGLALLAIGIADLSAGGLGGEIKSARKVVVATTTAMSAAAIGFFMTSTGGVPALAALLGTVFLASFGWSILRPCPCTASSQIVSVQVKDSSGAQSRPGHRLRQGSPPRAGGGGPCLARPPEDAGPSPGQGRERGSPSRPGPVVRPKSDCSVDMAVGPPRTGSSP
jgi:hypothetical protein